MLEMLTAKTISKQQRRRVRQNVAKRLVEEEIRKKRFKSGSQSESLGAQGSTSSENEAEVEADDNNDVSHVDSEVEVNSEERSSS